MPDPAQDAPSTEGDVHAFPDVPRTPQEPQEGRTAPVAPDAPRVAAPAAVDPLAVHQALQGDHPTAEVVQVEDEDLDFSAVTISPEAIANRGVPIELAEIREDGTLIRDETDAIVTREHHLRFDANSVAAVEEAWDGVTFQESEMVLEGPEAGTVVQFDRAFYGAEAFQAVLERRTTATLRQVLAIVFGETPETMGARMLPGKMADYSTAVGAAWAMANGADPTVAARIVEEGAKAQILATRDAMKELDQALGTADADAEETGTAPRPSN